MWNNFKYKNRYNIILRKFLNNWLGRILVRIFSVF
jgi:hypothetical protein